LTDVEIDVTVDVIRGVKVMSARVRTTVALPGALLKAVDAAIRAGSAKSRNEFFALALERQLEDQRRATIDASFAEMANDPIYQQEATEIEEAFRNADWEALRAVEGNG